MKPDKLSVKQLLAAIPDHYLEALAEENQLDLQHKKLPARDVFHLLLYALFAATEISWRVLEEHFQGTLFQKGFRPKASSIDHSSLGERLGKMPLAYFEDLFDYCHAWFARYHQPAEHKRFNLIRFDSTIVTLSANLLTQAMTAPGCKSKTKPARQAVKYSVGFNGSFAVKAKAYFQNTYHNENVALAELIHQTPRQAHDVAIFDRGLNGKKRLSALSVADIRFVTRISPTNLVERCWRVRFSTVVGEQDATVAVEEDTLVYGFTEREQRVESPFRLVVCRQLLTGERLYFLTNMLDVKALEVAQLYRLRWPIETFFKCLKQHMHFTHLLSRQRHTLQIMLYMSLIGASLLSLYRKLNELDSYKIAKLRFMNQLQMELMRIIWEGGYGKVLLTNENLAGP